MGLMLALMQLSALSLWGLWGYQAGPFAAETAALLDRWMESDYAFYCERDNRAPACLNGYCTRLPPDCSCWRSRKARWIHFH